MAQYGEGDGRMGTERALASSLECPTGDLALH